MVKNGSLYQGVVSAILISALTLLLNVRAEDEHREDISFHDIAPHDYDYLYPPMVEGEPVVVHIHMKNLIVRSVDESDMSLTLALELVQLWNDSRLWFPPWSKDPETKIYLLDSKWIDRVWQPNIFFPDAVSGQLNGVINPSSFFFMNRHSRFAFTCRLVVKLICEMDLVHFPQDEQECGLKISSAIYSDKEVVLKWLGIRLKHKFSSLQQFEIIGMENNKCDYMASTTRNVSCLVRSFTLRRRGGYYIINVYIPTVLIVIMSMLTFWIPPDAVPARVTLGVTSLLTIITKQYLAAMPSVSYVVALNVWLSACIAFVFFSLLEFAAVIALGTRSKNLMESPDLALPMILLRTNGTWATKQSRSINKKEKYSSGQRLDLFSRIFFPTTFLIFVITYWRYYS